MSKIKWAVYAAENRRGRQYMIGIRAGVGGYALTSWGPKRLAKEFETKRAAEVMRRMYAPSAREIRIEA